MPARLARCEFPDLPHPASKQVIAVTPCLAVRRQTAHEPILHCPKAVSMIAADNLGGTHSCSRGDLNRSHRLIAVANKEINLK
jgi:hypothetical protein